MRTIFVTTFIFRRRLDVIQIAQCCSEHNTNQILLSSVFMHVAIHVSIKFELCRLVIARASAVNNKCFKKELTFIAE